MSRRLGRQSEGAADASVRQNRFNEAADAINSLFYMSVIGLIMTFGAILVARGGLSVGGLAAFMMYNGLLTDPVMDFVDFYRQLQRTRVSIDRLNGFLGQPAYDDIDNTSAPHLTPTIALENVSFRYRRDHPALSNVSLRINAGEHLAIVGPSGCGKTTLSHLIAGIRTPTAGRLTVGGQQVDEESRNLIRASLTIVFQDPFLFNSSIRDNIRLGNPAASEQEINTAASLACLTPVIEQVPDGLNASIGENGASLSGGERQRVGLARAFLRNTPIYVLDEATSALDSTTSRTVLENLYGEFRDSTVIVVAHKLASVKNMPRIMVMRDGQIVADGTHEELMAECPDYSRLYHDQFLASQRQQNGTHGTITPESGTDS
jgi:ABC-type multidrug transport system fused ATPase/permease subunit